MRCKMNKFTLLEAPYRLYPPNNIGPTATPEQSCVETTADAKYGCEVSYAFSRDFRQRYDNCLTYSPRVCGDIESRFIEMQTRPWTMLLMMMAGWLNRHQQDVIEYLREENKILREKRGTKRGILLPYLWPDRSMISAHYHDFIFSR
jgi:hypothetical protein